MNATSSIDIAKLRDDLAKLDGLPPHNNQGNICWGDYIFAHSISRKYGLPIDDLRKIAGMPASNARSYTDLKWD